MTEDPEKVKELAARFVDVSIGYQPREILVALELTIAEMVRTFTRPEHAQDMLQVCIDSIRKVFNEDHTPHKS